MQFSVKFEGGTLDGKTMRWRSPVVCFGAERYETRYTEKYGIPLAYRFAGIKPLDELKDVPPVQIDELETDMTMLPKPDPWRIGECAATVFWIVTFFFVGFCGHRRA